MQCTADCTTGPWCAVALCQGCEPVGTAVEAGVIRPADALVLLLPVAACPALCVVEERVQEKSGWWYVCQACHSVFC